MDWLKLTAEDIERVQREARQSPPMPAVVRIGTGDLAASGRAQVTAAPIQITAADLAPIAARPRTSAELAELERLMFNLINAERLAGPARWLGDPELQWHGGLAAVSRGHSADMLERQYIEHHSPEGVSAADRISLAGIRYLACGENIGVVYGAASHGAQAVHEIHNAFMRQPIRPNNHRGNLLNPIWSHVGIGLAYQPDGVLIATQNFVSWPTKGP